MSSNLRPCPFCGSTAVALRVDDNGSDSWVYCERCTSIGPTAAPGQAVVGWNMREYTLDKAVLAAENQYLEASRDLRAARKRIDDLEADGRLADITETQLSIALQREAALRSRLAEVEAWALRAQQKIRNISDPYPMTQSEAEAFADRCPVKPSEDQAPDEQHGLTYRGWLYVRPLERGLILVDYPTAPEFPDITDIAAEVLFGSIDAYGDVYGELVLRPLAVPFDASPPWSSREK